MRPGTHDTVSSTLYFARANALPKRHARQLNGACFNVPSSPPSPSEALETDYVNACAQLIAYIGNSRRWHSHCTTERCTKHVLKKLRWLTAPTWAARASLIHQRRPRRRSEKTAAGNSETGGALRPWEGASVGQQAHTVSTNAHHSTKPHYRHHVGDAATRNFSAIQSSLLTLPYGETAPRTSRYCGKAYDAPMPLPISNRTLLPVLQRDTDTYSCTLKHKLHQPFNRNAIAVAP
ncbi:hypothetical protein TRVL_05031 [Trypanosoma vivax]|nr:hypothetical protein TRVL_05031 [Trypanosoma vivax]